ncbi:hypothetical protein [Pseudoalteromonas distincta]|uniref:hypothetical protein n=1 Tax=Pseudoalteromonas distincta TaxID=77608 RepID=UPI0011F0C7B0|nr:hypothetical protein [Pseudoalteromonas distincta]KAA1161449.1 hypothetical protein EU511_07885 [Pseudoalteromonas distincta]
MSEFGTIITAIISSLSVSLGGAWWLGRTMISHRLSKDLEDYKSERKRDLNQESLKLSGTVKKEVESYLGEQSATREYELEAKKRLYKALGPLRFQLLLACRDIAHRIEGHGSGKAYEMSSSNFYGRNTIYRILKPLAISELIESQVAYTDFSVDGSALDSLLFKKSCSLAFAGAEVSCNHPDIDWSNQSEHLFFDTLTEAASVLIFKEESTLRTLTFYEFNAQYDDLISNSGLLTISRIIEGFTMSSKPLFWLRLVSFGHICREFIGSAGKNLRFEYTHYNITGLIEKTEDDYILSRIDEFKKAVKKSVKTQL